MFSLRNILILIIVVALAGVGWRIYENIKETGREEIRTEVLRQNQELDENVREVNENITRSVTIETHRIERRSREIEDIINEQPREPITNVTRARLERMREQQRAISEADSQTE